MKRIILSLVMALLSLTFLPPAGANVEKPAVSAPAPKPGDEAEARVLISRLNEINKMAKTRLSPSEKKKMRKEVKAIKSHLKDISGGVYLSGSAILIIIIILILI